MTLEHLPLELVNEAERCRRILVILARRNQTVPYDEAEDLVSETMIRFYQSSNGLVEKDLILPRLVHALRHTIMNYHRDRKAILTGLDEALEIPSLPNSRTLECEDLLHHLTPELAKILREYYFEGKTMQEIADQCEVSAPMVLKRLQKAITQLQGLTSDTSTGGKL